MEDYNYAFKEHILQPGGENAVLFYSEYYLLRQLLVKVSHNDILRGRENILDNRVSPTFYEVNEQEGWSHDNHTGLVCLSKNTGKHIHRQLKWDNWVQRTHPRDLVFYRMIAGKKWANLFAWIPMVAMIVSCYQTHKVRNGMKIVKTDGKLLAWLRFNTIKMPTTKRICDYIINKKHGGWAKQFEIYFGSEHPNTVMARELYND